MLCFIPEILLLIAAFVVAFIKKKTLNPSSKVIFNTTRLFLILSMFSSVVFYNQVSCESFLKNDQYTIIIKIILYLYSIAWLSLSSRWFANKNRSGAGFCILSCFQIIALLILISAINLYLIGALIALIYTTNYLMLKIKRYDDISNTNLDQYKKFAIIFLICFFCGIALMPYTKLAGIVLILPAIFYLLGLAPFHFGFVNLVGNSVLPISGIIATIPVFSYFALINNLMTEISLPIEDVLQAFGIISLFTGAIYAINEKNIRTLFAYSSIFHFGFICIALSLNTPLAIFAAFTYLFVYILSQFGIFSSLFGFKYNGEYQKELNNLSGIASCSPYISAYFIIFIISLMGCPPIIGFLGRLSIINHLVVTHSYILIACILTALMIMIYAYLLVIKVIYFQTAPKQFDRIDNGVYLVLFANSFFVLISTFKPIYIISYLQNLLEKL